MTKKCKNSQKSNKISRTSFNRGINPAYNRGQCTNQNIWGRSSKTLLPELNKSNENEKNEIFKIEGRPIQDNIFLKKQSEGPNQFTYLQIPSKIDDSKNPKNREITKKRKVAPITQNFKNWIFSSTQ